MIISLRKDWFHRPGFIVPSAVAIPQMESGRTGVGNSRRRPGRVWSYGYEAKAEGSFLRNFVGDNQQTGSARHAQAGAVRFEHTSADALEELYMSNVPKLKIENLHVNVEGKEILKGVNLKSTAAKCTPSWVLTGREKARWLRR